MTLKFKNKGIWVFVFWVILGLFSGKANHTPGISQINIECIGNDKYIVTVEGVVHDDHTPDQTRQLVLNTNSCGVQVFYLPLIKTEEFTRACAFDPTGCLCCSAPAEHDCNLMLYYQGIIDLSGINCCELTFSVYHSHWRALLNIANINTNQLYVESFIDVCKATCPSTPKFIVDPLTEYCNGQGVQMSQRAVPDKPDDSLVYKLVPPLIASGTPAPNNTGYSYDEPVDYLGKNLLNGKNLPFPYGFHLDPVTGDIAFTFDYKTGDTWYCMATKVEQYRDDKLISHITRDACFSVEPTCSKTSPVFSPPPEPEYFICAGEEFSLDITTDDVDPAGPNMVYLEWDNLIDSATYIPDSGMGTATGTFTWTPDTSDIKHNPYLVTYFAKNNQCPIIGERSKTFKLYVNPEPEISFSHTLTGCGKVKFDAEVLNIDGGEFTWDIEGEFDTTADNFTYTFSEPGQYPYTVTLSEVGCERVFYDTITIDGMLSIDAGEDASLCQGSSHFINPKAYNAVGTVTWEASGQSFSDSIEITPTGDTTVIVFAQDSLGCLATDIIHITMHKIPVHDVDDHIFCFNETPLVSTANYPEFDITWRNQNGHILGAAGELEIQQAGNYTIEYANPADASCAVTGTFEVFKATQPSHKLDDLVLCDGSDLTVEAPLDVAWYEWRHLTTGNVLGHAKTLEHSAPEAGHILLEAGEVVENRTCTYRDTFEVEIVTVTDTGLTPPFFICLNSGPQQLPVSFLGETVWTGPGVDGNNVWNLHEAGPGQHELSYVYTDDASGCTLSRTYHSEIYPLPDLSFTVTPTSGQSPLQIQLQATAGVPVKDMLWTIWDENGKNKISHYGMMETTQTLNDSGAYSITFAATDTTNGCRDTVTKEHAVNVWPRIFNLISPADEREIRVYPNPAGDVLNIRSEEVLQRVTLTTITGRKVISKTPEREVIQLERGELPAGSYMLYLEYTDGRAERVGVVFE